MSAPRASRLLRHSNQYVRYRLIRVCICARLDRPARQKKNERTTALIITAPVDRQQKYTRKAASAVRKKGEQHFDTLYVRPADHRSVQFHILVAAATTLYGITPQRVLIVAQRGARSVTAHQLQYDHRQ